MIQTNSQQQQRCKNSEVFFPACLVQGSAGFFLFGEAVFFHRTNTDMAITK
jgi:hypothetical protein